MPARVTDLPADHGVGPAALMYHRAVDADSFNPVSRTFEQNDVYLVTRSGEHFRVGRTPPDTGPLNLSLSPDGRWLGGKRDGRWWLRDLSAVTEYEVPEEHELLRWSTDGRSALLGKPGTAWTFATMALPGGTVRQLTVALPPAAAVVAFIAGRELAVFDPKPLLVGSAPHEVAVTLKDILTGEGRALPVVVPGQLVPGEVAGPFALIHGGGSPPSIWVEVGRPDLVPASAPEGMLVAPSVALLGVDVASGVAAGRIEIAPSGAGGRQLCRGVVADGAVVQRETGAGTELLVVDPRRNVRRLVTTFPESVTVLAPGATT
ncbi:hypothetical protein ACTWLT_26920 [Micromonospora sp. ZYX-F-536]|uniref:hypothetical protein n=1 Tax=Micromonospora sp. ZYX-F-536 TaxID=3457629 RepID=UPI004040A36E